MMRSVRAPSRSNQRLESALGAARFDPARLGLRALYDYRGSSATKIVDLSGNGVADATVGAGSNSPLWLPYTRPQVYLVGSVTSNIMLPDSAVLDITDDIEMVFYGAADDWSPSTQQGLITKHSNAANVAYSWETTSSGVFLWRYSPDGTTASQSLAFSTVGHGFTDGAWYWSKVTRRRSDGRVQFWTCPDQPTEPTAGQWTQLGSDVIAGTDAIFNSAATLTIGTQSASLALSFSGKVGRAIIRNGIDGTTVADFNAALCGQTGYAGSLGGVWTVNRPTSGRKSVVQSPAARSAKGVWLYGTDDYTDLPTTAIPAMALANAAEVLVVVRQWSTPTSFGNYLSTRAAGAGQAGLAITSDGTSSTSLYGTISDGVATPTINATVAGAGIRNVIGLRRNTTSGLLHVNGASGTSVNLAAVGATAGTTPRIGVRAGGTGYQDFEFEAFLSVDRLLTAAELAEVVAFYGGGL